jgi:hypothetical protein
MKNVLTSDHMKHPSERVLSYFPTARVAGSYLSNQIQFPLRGPSGNCSFISIKAPFEILRLSPEKSQPPGAAQNDCSVPQMANRMNHPVGKILPPVVLLERIHPNPAVVCAGPFTVAARPDDAPGVGSLKDKRASVNVLRLTERTARLERFSHRSCCLSHFTNPVFIWARQLCRCRTQTTLSERTN